MWIFQISTGKVFEDGDYVGSAYSGAPGFVDNPSAENLSNEGPLPEGIYTLGTPVDDVDTGEFSIPLIPSPDNQMYGRGEFRWHGDSIKHPGCASKGCMVSALALRKTAWDSGDHQLQVTK